MKAMILAAGIGSRMGALTQNTPKPLLCVAGKPLIVHHIENLVKHNIHNIVINVHYLAEKIMETLGDGKAFGAKLHYSYEPTLLDTAGGIAQALPLLGDDPFWVISADIYCDFIFNPPVLAETDNAHLILIENSNEHLDFHLHNGRVASEDPHYTYGNMGYYRSALFKSLPINQPYALGTLLKTAVLNHLVSGEIFQGRWINVGCPEKLAQANQYFEE